MSPPLIILGAGGHSRVLVHVLKQLDKEIEGITDPAEQFADRDQVHGVPFLGTDAVLEGYSTAEVKLVNAVASTALPTRHRKIYEQFSDQGYLFTSVISPEAVLAEPEHLQPGVQVMASATIQPSTLLHKNVIVNTAASVDHDCEIGPHSHIAPGATLSGNVEVGEAVHVGTGANIIQGITVGREAVIGAGSVVLDDVPPGTTYAGNPAQEIDVS